MSRLVAPLLLLTLACGGPVPESDATDEESGPTEDVGSRLLEGGAEGIERTPAESDFVSVRGMFVGLFQPGPPALFTDCASGETYRLAAGPIADSLIVAYPELGLGGEPVGVTVEGFTLEAPDGTATLRVLQFHSFERVVDCGQPVVDLPLDRTEWVLVEVLGRPVAEGSGAGILFDRGNERISGSTGCNSFSGGYEVVGTLLTLTALGMTRMACPPEQTQLETDVLEAFRLAGSYRIVGSELQLLGESGPVATYRSS